MIFQWLRQNVADFTIFSGACGPRLRRGPCRFPPSITISRTTVNLGVNIEKVWSALVRAWCSWILWSA